MRIISLFARFLRRKEIYIECYGLNIFPAVCDVGTYQVTQCNTDNKGFKDTSAYLNIVKSEVDKYFNTDTFYWNPQIVKDEAELKKFMRNDKSFNLFIPYNSKKTVFTGFKFTFYNKKIRFPKLFKKRCDDGINCCINNKPIAK